MPRRLSDRRISDAKLSTADEAGYVREIVEIAAKLRDSAISLSIDQPNHLGPVCCDAYIGLVNGEIQTLRSAT
jgi:hypothetical protein